MKIWNASASKFYSETMNALAGFFGLSAEDTTEAELHQHLTEAGTLENIRGAAVAEANAAVQTQMADFQTQLSDLQAQLAALKTDAESKGEKVTELENDLSAVRAQLSEKDTEIEKQIGQIKTLSGTVASLQAGKPIDKVTPPDESKPIEQAQSTTGGRVVSMKEIEAAMN